MRLPPNAGAIMRARRAGMIPTPGIFGHVAVLPDWDIETTGAFVLAPPNLEPSDLDFSFLAGLDCTLFLRESDAERVAPLLDAILHGAPRCLVVVNMERAKAGFGDGIARIFQQRPAHE